MGILPMSLTGVRPVVCFSLLSSFLWNNESNSEDASVRACDPRRGGLRRMATFDRTAEMLGLVQIRVTRWMRPVMPQL
jgi:hypothetical protein